MDLADEMTDTYPRWICPIYDNYNPKKIFCTRRPELCDDDIIFDLGIYGIKNTSKSSKEINQAFEKFSFEQGMFKGFFQHVTLPMMIFGINLINQNMIL